MAITLIQTNDANRFNVTFRDKLDVDSQNNVIEGFVQFKNDMWYAFVNDACVAVNENPVTAAKAIIKDYDRRAYAALERNIKATEKSLNEMPENRLKDARRRLLDGMKHRLETGDY